MAIASRFALESLRMFAAVIVWSLHFLFIYVFTALACARRFHELGWLGAGIVSWAVALATLAAVAGILSVAWPAWSNLRQGRSASTPAFMDWMTLAFSGLSLLAVLWEAVPVVLVPTC